MKIECIRTHHLRHRLDEPFGFSQWTYDTRNALLVEILADGGIAGWGECYGPAEVNQAAVAGFYAPRLLGKDPAGIDVLWHEMWRASLDFARGGVMMGAISGIDMALWDLKGKALGCSVSDLMGGRYRESVPCYATGMYFKKLPEDALIEALAREATGYRDQGYRALKIKVGKNVAFDLRLIETIRDALPEMTLMARPWTRRGSPGSRSRSRLSIPSCIGRCTRKSTWRSRPASASRRDSASSGFWAPAACRSPSPTWPTAAGRPRR